MPKQTVDAWRDLIIDLNQFAPLADKLVERAVRLAETLRDLGAPPATRVLNAIPGMLHFEWLNNRTTIVIAMQQDQIQSVSYSNQGESSSEVFSWEAPAIQGLLGLPQPMSEASPLGRKELFHA